MASSELPSPSRGATLQSELDFIELLQFFSKNRPSEHLKPAATSRGFHNPSPPVAKADQIGFLHLPDHIRKRIYELVSYRHDHGVVFLPRGLPRKRGLKADTKYEESEGVDGEFLTEFGEPFKLLIRKTASAKGSTPTGRWVEEEDLAKANFLSLGLPLASVKLMTDKDILDFIGDEDSSSDIHDDFALPPSGRDVDRVPDSVFGATEVLDMQSSDATESGWVDCSCDCHSSSSESQPSADMNDDECGDDEIPALPTQDAEVQNTVCSCGSAECHVCCELAAHFEDSDSSEGNVFAHGEHGEGEDMEHYDTHELFGMLYEPKEPAILLCCREIRSQCLPIYYGRNSFSWRFIWTARARASSLGQRPSRQRTSYSSVRSHLKGAMQSKKASNSPSRSICSRSIPSSRPVCTQKTTTPTSPTPSIEKWPRTSGSWCSLCNHVRPCLLDIFASSQISLCRACIGE